MLLRKPMKLLFLLTFVIYGFSVNATTYYVSNAGNDANSGTDPTTPIQTLGQVNSLKLVNGDQVLFKSGDVFLGQLKVQAASVTYAAYGTGARPVITGFISVTEWTNTGGNIWESTTAVSKLSTVKCVVINNVNTPMGRYPNTKSDGFRPSYFPFQSHSGNTSITSSSLGATNWTGADVVIRENHWTLNKSTITGQWGGTLNFNGTANSPTEDGYGFWIQNDKRTLDVQNEWYYNPSTHKIDIYSTSKPNNVLVTTVDTLAYVFGKDNVTFKNLDFEGANGTAIVFSNSNYGAVLYCDIHYTGEYGIDYQHSSNYADIENNNFHWLGSSGFFSQDGTNFTFKHDTLVNIGLVSSILPNDYLGGGLNAAAANSIYQYNVLDSLAYTGIDFRGGNTDVNHNYVRNWAMIREDAGGIYTGFAGEAGKQIHDNIVIDGVGNDDGTTGGIAANGIYIDDYGNNLKIYNNTIANISSAGIFLHNAYSNILTGNTIFNTSTGGSWTKGGIIIQTDASMQTHQTRNNRISNNIFFNIKQNTYAIFSFNSVSTADSKLFGVSDSNYFVNPIINDEKMFDLWDNDNYSDKYYNLLAFQNFTGQDAHSFTSPKLVTSTDEVKFVYNPNNYDIIIPLSYKYIDAKGKTYDGAITLAPFSSAVLIQDGPSSSPVNKPPIANAGSDQTILLPTDSITLTGSANDSDGTIVSYLWTKISGPSATISDSTLASTDVSDLVQGNYQFELTVTDDKGAVGKDIVNVIVSLASNKPPTANGGSDQVILLPTDSITLTGTANDSDGTIVSYLWTKISGPSATISDSTLASVTVTGLVQGNYQFELTVTDDNGAAGTDIVNVTVNTASNNPPTANAGTDQTITLPTDSLILTGSGKDVDGTIASYLWTKISGPSATILNKTLASTTIKGLAQGNYQFELKVTDDKGSVGTDIVNVTVNPAPNKPPIANAGTDQTITLPTDSLTLTGNGKDIDGTIASYLWTKISGPSATILNNTLASTIIKGLAQGNYQFELKVTDNKGAVGKDTVNVTVKTAPNKPPTANAGPDQTITLPTSSAILKGSGMDIDGTISSYSWVKISGPAVKMLHSSSAAVTIKGLAQGIYQFELTVTDNKGAVGKDTVAVTVNSVIAAANVPPTADAGTDQTITLPSDSITLTGSGKDTDGTIASYVWTKVSGPSATISNNALASTTVNGLLQGNYQFELTVTDDNGAVGKDIVNVIVHPAPNAPPTANAGTDQNVTLPINSITLTGSGNDSDGTIASYFWAIISGPSATISNRNQASTAVTDLLQGIYQFELTVTDDKGAVGKDTVIITVKPDPNKRPTANAGPDQTITLPSNSTTLNGSGNDSDGTISSYLWTKIFGPSVTISNSTMATTTIKGLVEGIYQFELTVTDDKGAIGKDIINVTVNPAPNKPPTANAGSNQTITLPTNSIKLNGMGTDSDGTIASYSWIKLSGASGTISNSSMASTAVNGLVQGNYQFELTVTDDKGAVGKDIVNVTVNPAPNKPPTANAGSNQTITLPSNSVTLTGSGLDPDGTIASYSWIKLSGASATISNSSMASTAVNGLVEGNYQFELTVTDDKGAVGKDIVNVTVNPAPNKPPTANAGSNQTITLPTNSIKLNGMGTDSDGTIAFYSWTKLSGASATISNSSMASTAVNGLVQGNYQFELTVTDDKGAVGKDIVNVTVNPAPNKPPTANAGSNQTITLPTNSIKLNGMGTDSDGTIAFYSWTKLSGASATISNSSMASTAVNGLVQGNYQFELTVTDDKGAVGKDTVKVTVNAAAAVNKAPVANAGSDQTITLPTNSTQLSGSGTDADGTISSFGWKKIAGPSTFTIVNSSSYIVTINNLVAGVYQFELTVADDKGATGKDTVKVVVNAATTANQPPVANAGVDQVLTLPNNSTSVNGIGTDADGTIISYSWTKISGPASYAIADPSLATTMISDLQEGVYQIQLKVTDDKGNVGMDTIQITVNASSVTNNEPVNQAPLANAGADMTIVSSSGLLTLNGSGTDNDGQVVSYYWHQLTGPSIAEIGQPTSASTAIKNLTGGTYEFELTVADNNGAVGKDTVNVTVALERLAPKSGKLSVYPNPVHDIANLEVSTPQNNTNVMIVITDMSGTTVYNKEFVSNSIQVNQQIDMSNLAKGVYVVSVFFDGMEKQSVKVVRL